MAIWGRSRKALGTSSAAEDAEWERLVTLAAQWGAPLTAVVYGELRALREAAPVVTLTRLIEQGALATLLDVASDPAHFHRMESAVQELVVRGGQESVPAVESVLSRAGRVPPGGTARTLAEAAQPREPGSILRVRFDRYNPSAVTAAQREGAALVRLVSDDVRTNITTAVQNGLRAGSGAKAIATQVREGLGLTPRQMQAVANYRHELETGKAGALERALRDRRHDRTVARVIGGSKTLTPTEIDTLVAKYAERYVRYRAETIARTETLKAMHAGQRNVWEQSAANGLLKLTELVRTWHTAHDERTCKLCAPIPGLNPDGVGFDEPFITPTGEYVMYPPLHPDCRCVIFVSLRY